MTVLGDDHRARSFILPDEHVDRLRIVAQRQKVALRQELIVGHALGELEAIALVLPQSNLVDDRGRQRRFGLDGMIVGEHL